MVPPPPKKATTTIPADLSYEQFVVIAENECKFEFGNSSTNLCNCQDPYCGHCGKYIQANCSMKIGPIGWNVKFHSNNKIELSCQGVADGTVDEMHMELVGYHRKELAESYAQITPTRHNFTPSANLLVVNNLSGRDKVFTVRILKDRPMFPDFTLDKTTIGRFEANLKLRVADQLFHVNKQLLSVHSDHFDRMFNGPYVEGNQEEVELKHEQADPAVFHDFLLVMCVRETLPNPKNVAALLDLANIYQTENVRDKCHHHLWMCREMAVEKRYLLAGEFGLNELQTSLMNNASFEEAKRMLAVATKKAFAIK